MNETDAGSGHVVALIPAYQAARHVGAVVTEAKKHLPVLVVDDGSTDGTGGVAEAQGAMVVRQEPNQGKGAALVTGFRWAIEKGVQAVVMLDADGQHDPAEIPKFIEAWQQRGADLIIGARDFEHMPFVRRMSNTIGRQAFSWAMGREILDNQSGYRMLSRRLIEAMLESEEKGFEFEMDMIVIAAKRDWLIDWVPIRTIYADEVSHIRPVDHVVNFFRMVNATRKKMSG